jgi:phosphomannomutase
MDRKMIKDFPEQEFIGGGEESFGYMVGDAVRDKDAVAATLLICEVAARQSERKYRLQRIIAIVCRTWIL